MPTLNWTAVGSQAGRGHGRSEEELGWRVGGRKQEGGREEARGGREGGMLCRESVSGGREG